MSRFNWLYQNVAETLADAQVVEDGAGQESDDDGGKAEACLGPTSQATKRSICSALVLTEDGDCQREEGEWRRGGELPWFCSPSFGIHRVALLLGN
jgi:hypothetical protein